LGVIPFAVDTTVHTAWDEFVQGKVNWISLTLSGESVQLESSQQVTVEQNLSSVARADIAS
jgi:hypothetical protein